MFLLLPSCTLEKKPVEKETQKVDFSRETAKNINMYYSDSAKVLAIVQAPSLVSFLSQENPRTEFPDGVNVRFFESDASLKSQLTANYAVKNDKTGTITVRDSVVFKNIKEQQKMETEEMIWEEKDGSIYSDKFVKVTTLTEIIEGFGFRSNSDFSEWSMDTISGIVKTKSFKVD